MLEYMPLMLQGLLTTVEIFVITLVLSLPLGLPIALGEESKIKPLAYLCKLYVFIFRGTPLMLQLMFFYFFLPIAFDIRISGFSTACLTFVLNYAAYFAEIYRGGMKSIDSGQYEAAYALGLSRKQTLFGIVLPQMMKVILPPVANEAITLVKDSALVMVISVQEIMKVTYSTVNRTLDMTPFFVAGVLYLIMTFILTILTSRLEKYFARYDRKED